MQCEMFENHLDGYFDGSLSELERQSMEEHMQACPECRREYEAQKLLLEELRHLDDGVTAPPDLVSGAMERIRRERQPRKRRAAGKEEGVGEESPVDGGKDAVPAAAGEPGHHS